MTGRPDKLERRPIRRLYGYSLKYKGRLILGFLFSLVGGGSIVGMLTKMEPMANAAFDKATQSVSTMLWSAVLLILFFATQGLAKYFNVYFVNWVGFKVVEELRRECFDKLQKLQLSFYSRHSSGALISRVTNDTTQVQHAVSGVVADLFYQPVVLIAALGFVLVRDPFLGLLCFVVFPVCIAPVLIFGRKVKRYSRQSQEFLSELASVLQENVSGVRVVKAFGMEAYEQAKFDRENSKVFGRLIKMILARNVNQPLMELVSAFAIVAILVYAKTSGMEPGGFLALVGAMGMMYQPAKRLGRVHMEIQKAVGAAERIFDLLDEELDVVEKEGAMAFDEDVREIRFEHVGFHYGDDPVLDGINLTVRSGETVALVGASGSGKSSLVSLVPRFYDPTEGRVLLNDHDLRDLSFASLRDRIALVTQDTFLFNDTIANNIAYGRKNVSREQIEDAARRAHAHEFILEQPEGYETIVGERGGRLSGGQKQRIAIARAIFADAPILILDEATSALDNESERQVQAAINEMMRGRTTIAIAHRLSTIQHSDRIVVLEEGRVVEEGTHADLLERDGVYRRLYDLQFQL